MLKILASLILPVTGFAGRVERVITGTGNRVLIYFADRSLGPEGVQPDVDCRVVTPDYFSTMQIPVRIKSNAPLLMFGEFVYELCLMRSKHVDTKLKELAAMRASSLVGCPG